MPYRVPTHLALIVHPRTPTATNWVKLEAISQLRDPLQTRQDIELPSRHRNRPLVSSIDAHKPLQDVVVPQGGRFLRLGAADPAPLICFATAGQACHLTGRPPRPTSPRTRRETES